MQNLLFLEAELNLGGKVLIRGERIEMSHKWALGHEMIFNFLYFDDFSMN